MGNSIAEARDRSQSSPRSLSRKIKGKSGKDSDSSSRGSTLTINSDIQPSTSSSKPNKSGLRENRSTQNFEALLKQQPKQAQTETIKEEKKKDARSLSPTQFRKFFEDQNQLDNYNPSSKAPTKHNHLNQQQQQQQQQQPQPQQPTTTTTTTTGASGTSGGTSNITNQTTTTTTTNKPPQVPKMAAAHHQQPDFQIRGPIALRPKTNPIYDDYIITKQVLGLGISGKVISCQHKQTKIKYALKTLRDSQKARREIDLQWRACQGCRYIVQIVDVYENVINNQKVFLIVMECMEGGELFAKISERTTPFTEQEVAKIMHQICTAVKHLHSMKIAHRDLKPENLLLSTNNENAIIKLTDFGFAKEVSLGLATPCYTPYYVAPEVLGSERYDISCDIWSLGVIMYILCCGYPPFYSTHGQPISPGMKRRIKAGEYAFPEAEWSRVSQEAKDLIAGMLETMPEKRSTIDDIVNSNWISRYYNVPQTPLPSVEILKEDKDNWKEVQQNMRMALDEMRINWDAKTKITLDPSKNKLFEKRTKKNKPGVAGDSTIPEEPAVLGPVKTTAPAETSTAAAVAPKKLATTEHMVVEDLSREASTVTMRNENSPSNSRPSSPKLTK